MIRWLTAFFRSRDQRVLDLESALDAERRKLSVAGAEIESLAAVIARDRQRIQAETAAYARQQADAEGLTNERNIEGFGRRSA